MSILSVLLLSVLVLLILMWLHDAYLRRQIEKNHPSSGLFQTFKGGELHYIEYGQASELAPIVLIHGSSGSARDMAAAFFSHFGSATHVISVDRPGIGYSRNFIDDDELSSPRAQARAIHEAMTTLGVVRPIIVGHSWGGAVAMAYAMEFGTELSGVVAIAPPLYPWGGKPGWYERLVTTPIIGSLFMHTILTKYGSTQLQAGIERNFYPEIPPDGFVDTISLPLILRPRPFCANSVYSMALDGHLKEMSAHYKQPACDLLLVSGDSDHTVSCKRNIERFHADISSSRLKVFKGVGHMPHHTQASVLSKEILKMAKKATGRMPSSQSSGHL